MRRKREGVQIENIEAELWGVWSTAARGGGVGVGLGLIGVCEKGLNEAQGKEKRRERSARWVAKM